VGVWVKARSAFLLAYNLPQNIAVSVLTTKNAKSTKNVSNITNFSVFFAFFVVKIGIHLTLSQCFFAAKPRGWLSAFSISAFLFSAFQLSVFSFSAFLFSIPAAPQANGI
jgi:hypothetical protein